MGSDLHMSPPREWRTADWHRTDDELSLVVTQHNDFGTSERVHEVASPTDSELELIAKLTGLHIPPRPDLVEVQVKFTVDKSRMQEFIEALQEFASKDSYELSL